MKWRVIRYTYFKSRQRSTALQYLASDGGWTWLETRGRVFDWWLHAWWHKLLAQGDEVVSA